MQKHHQHKADSHGDQKKKVNIIKYVMKDSIEEKIYELQKRKKLLSDSVIEAEEIFVNQLTKEEIAGLFE